MKAETGLGSAGVLPLQQRLQGPGVPRQAAAWETEARSVADFLARIVNTERPRP